MTNKLEMQQYGRTLTDRPYGATIAQKIIQSEQFPVSLDFKGVISLGSSFGDEILSAILSKKQTTLEIYRANEAIKSCLEKVSGDIAIKLEFCD